SSFDILFKARAQALAVKYWGRKLRKYEKAEIFETSVDFVHLKGREVQLSLSDVELLEIAFKASADAGAPNVSYIRGVYSNWRQKRIFTPDDYWENEVKRDHVVI
ncbi:MAG: DnaD domain protein, partial [Clostridia bacterium]|nr:DnaD domain protein [Clostridia bacterium]